ncbi:MAG TPA: hypothetical protein VJT32_11870 [bacterium]|nr:hypothetical protein [bacterium]
MTYNLSGFPQHAQAMLHAILVEQGRRYVVAYHPLHRTAVIRHKDAAGATEWRLRDWRLFEGKTPFIADVTDDVVGALKQLYAWETADACQVVIGFLPDRRAEEHPAITSCGPLRPSRILQDRPATARPQIVLREPGPGTDADLTAGRLHDLTQSWGGDVVPFPAPRVSRVVTLREGARQITVHATVRNVPWGIVPAVVVIEVHDGRGIVWDVQLPPDLVGGFAQAIHDVAADAAQALEDSR